MAITAVLSVTLLASLVIAHAIAAERARAHRRRATPAPGAPDGFARHRLARFFVGWRLAAAFGTFTLVGMVMMTLANLNGAGLGTWSEVVDSRRRNRRLDHQRRSVPPGVDGGAAPSSARRSRDARGGVDGARVGARNTATVIATRADSTWMSRTRSLSALAGLAFLVGGFGFSSDPQPGDEPSVEFRTALTVATFEADGAGRVAPTARRSARVPGR